MTVKSVRLALAAAVTILGIGGCSGGESGTQLPEVATLARSSASPAVSTSPSAPAQERPRQRLDGTEADYQALLQPYRKCMIAQGITSEKGSTGWAGGEDVPDAQHRAQEACKMLWPLPAWELDPANPEAKDFTHDVVKCLKAKGVEYVEPAEGGVGISLGGARNDAESITKGMELTGACEREVAGRR